VRDWVIRMPRAQMRQRPMAMGTEVVVVGFQEVGGNVLEIKTRSGTIVYRSESASEALAATPTNAPLPAPATISSAPAPAPASAPAAASVAPATAPGTTPARAVGLARNRNSNVIEGAEIEASTANDAYALVQDARPTWLHSRGIISIRDPDAGVVQVYLNGNPFGDVNKLREIQRLEIRELRFFGAADAQLRYGVGHAGGVIEVSTGAVAPTGGEPIAEPSPASNSNVLKAEEFEESTAIDLMALVQEFRPTWLHSRGVTSIRDQSAGQLRVYLNGVSAGDVNQLREIRVSDVKELRFLPAAQAHARYGVGHEGGVIEVLTK